VKGFIISFEGIDGSGKSTHSTKLYQFLKGLGLDVSLYRDPGSTTIAEQLRHIVLENNLDPITELLIFESARSSLIWENILPDLRDGKIIILDRFIDSTTAYQGYGREINLGTVSILNHIACRGIKPNLTFLLNVSLELAMQRINKKRTRFEDLQYLKRVREGYLQIFHSEKERDIVLIDADRSEEEVFEDIKNITIEKLRAVLK